MTSSKERFQRVIFMFALVLASEAIFGLPFHIGRFFRPTLLDVLGFTNTELGVAMGIYGVVAMLAYFPGGPLADRFSARKLMAASLIATSLGGLYFATFPGVKGTQIVYAWWGATTILLFWAALIRATREWGGSDEQGRAYGLLDGGRGLLAAITGSAAVLLFASLLPENPASATLAERTAALTRIVYVYTAITFLAGIFVWFAIPDSSADASNQRARQRMRWADVRKVFRLRAIWMQSTIVICAYAAFKGIDNFSLYAAQAWGMNEVEASKVSALAQWTRPFAALGAGLLADRVRGSLVIAGCFLGLTCIFLFFGIAPAFPGAAWILFANVLVSAAAVFGLRGVYFALFEEASVPRAFTGTAAGLVSVVGFSPEVFVAPIAGWLLDRSPGIQGHQHVFLFLSGFAVLGLIVSLEFLRTSKRNGWKNQRLE